MGLKKRCITLIAQLCQIRKLRLAWPSNIAMPLHASLSGSPARINIKGPAGNISLNEILYTLLLYGFTNYLNK